MRPIGSEKISNLDEKLNRIKHIAGISAVNESTKKTQQNGSKSTILHESVASNGDEYAIVQEEKYIYIKRKINEDYDYMTGVENLREFSFKTYTDALKYLNLMYKNINQLNGIKEGMNILKKKV